MAEYIDKALNDMEELDVLPEDGRSDVLTAALQLMLVSSPVRS